MVSYQLLVLAFVQMLKGLNPYCSGQWSRTLLRRLKYTWHLAVLILILVDNGLVPYDDELKASVDKS